MTFHANTGLPLTDTRAFGTPIAQTYTYERQSDGLPTATVDTLGRRTEYIYDTKSNVTSATYLAGTANAFTVARTYTANFNQVATVTDPLGHTTTYSYDSPLGRLTQIQDPLSHNTQIDYNATNLVTRVTDPLLNITTFSYDRSDLMGVTDALGRTTSFFVDELGRTQATTDALGNTSVAQYDVVDRVIQSIDPLGQATSFVYDGNGNLTTVTDARGGVTQFGYDTKNRQTSRTDPLLRVETFEYDTNDNLTKVIDRKNQVSGMTYDALNRRSQVGFGATIANPTSYSSTIAYTYDAANRLTQAVDSVSGTITRNYDDRFDAVAQELTSQGQVNYTYDAASRRASMTVAGQSAITYAFDNANRLNQITQGTSQVALTYDNANRRQTLTLPNGVVQTYSYDAANQLTGITYTKGATTLGDLTYTYDAAGRRTSSGGSYARTNMPSAVTSTTFNAINQVTSQNGITLTYDNNGNLLGDGVNTYAWGPRNKLTSISGGTTASFQYDALGRRQSKTIGGTQTGYVYDGLNFVQEKSGASVVANLLTGLGIDEVYARTQGTTTSTLVTDALGSTLALTDVAGAVTNAYTYGPYGTRTVTGMVNGNSQQYTGREDDGTGLLFFRARYYHPAMARFISEDPIGLAGGVNSYAYVGGNPVSKRDPLGLDPNNPPTCNGTNCVDPPFDPTPDGPAPSPQGSGEPSQQKGKKDAGRYDICPETEWPKKACKWCIDWACNSSPGARAYCCEVDAKKCRAGSEGDPIATARCNAEHASCTARGASKQ